MFVCLSVCGEVEWMNVWCGLVEVAEPVANAVSGVQGG